MMEIRHIDVLRELSPSYGTKVAWLVTQVLKSKLEETNFKFARKLLTQYNHKGLIDEHYRLTAKGLEAMEDTHKFSYLFESIETSIS